MKDGTSKDSSSRKEFNDAIYVETIRKEMRKHKLYESYMLTPTKMQTLFISTKPTGDPTINGKEKEDEDYLKFVNKQKMKPRDLYENPITTSQTYGWDTEVLHRNTDRRFHFPRVISDISKFGELLGPLAANQQRSDKKTAAK